MTRQPIGAAAEARALLDALGVSAAALSGGDRIARTPVTGEEIARPVETSPAAAVLGIDRAHRAFLAWRKVPAPRRGGLVRLFGEELRRN